jgi:hypothetical protein
LNVLVASFDKITSVNAVNSSSILKKVAELMGTRELGGFALN